MLREWSVQVGVNVARRVTALTARAAVTKIGCLEGHRWIELTPQHEGPINLTAVVRSSNREPPLVFVAQPINDKE